jgi:hypothetical protein
MWAPPETVERVDGLRGQDKAACASGTLSGNFSGLAVIKQKLVDAG